MKTQVQNQSPVACRRMPARTCGVEQELHTGGRPSSTRNAQAFSLIEIIVSVSLLTVIMLGLMAMFNQTQQAFRIGTAQTDVLESGRAVMDMIARDLKQTTPTHVSRTTNFLVELSPPRSRIQVGDRNVPKPLLQTLPATTRLRTNLLQDFYFVTRANQTWTGTGYLVGRAADGIGTLYRFESPPNVPVSRLGKEFDDAITYL